MSNKAYKYRIYPNRTQREQLAKTFGCVRFVYNKCLDEQENNYYKHKPYISKNNMNTYCNHTLKTAYPFLREVDKFALTNAVYHLDDAYKRLFKHLGNHPKHKSKKKSKKSYTTNYTNGNIKVLGNAIKLPKLGNVKAVIHRVAPDDYVLKNVTVTQYADQSYYVSVLYEYDNQVPVNTGSRAIGLDYKSNGLYVTSDGDCADMPKYYRKSEAKLAKLQRKLRNKKLGSNNRVKYNRKVAKLYRHVANQRRDFLHKRSTEIANQYDIVCIESLDMKAMSNKGFGNGKATLDNGYGMFCDMLGYKLVNRGKTLVKVGKWFPSSQLCCVCGNRMSMPLSVRRYECSCCGNVMDRDVNAAINIRDEGLRLLL